MTMERKVFGRHNDGDGGSKIDSLSSSRISFAEDPALSLPSSCARGNHRAMTCRSR